MVNSSKRVIFVAFLILASFALANSEATCPLDEILKLESCSSLVDRLLSGGFGNPPKAQQQCYNALGGLDGQVAADCLCIIINGDVFGKNNANVDSVLGSIFNICQNKVLAGYRCVVWLCDSALWVIVVMWSWDVFFGWNVLHYLIKFMFFLLLQIIK